MAPTGSRRLVPCEVRRTRLHGTSKLRDCESGRTWNDAQKPNDLLQMRPALSWKPLLHSSIDSPRVLACRHAPTVP
eukprot:719642-Amphidinium_carterae.1